MGSGCRGERLTGGTCGRGGEAGELRLCGCQWRNLSARSGGWASRRVGGRGILRAESGGHVERNPCVVSADEATGEQMQSVTSKPGQSILLLPLSLAPSGGSRMLRGRWWQGSSSLSRSEVRVETQTQQRMIWLLLVLSSLPGQRIWLPSSAALRLAVSSAGPAPPWLSRRPAHQPLCCI